MGKVLKEKRRQDILNSAMEIFGEKGFHKGTIEDIAHNANIGKGTVYEYFDSKQEIFEQMILETLRGYTGEAKLVVDKENTTKGKLRALLTFNIEFVEKKSAIIEKAFFGFENISKDFIPSIMKLHDKIFIFIQDLVEEGIRKGEINNSYDPKVITNILVNISYGLNNGKRVFNNSRPEESKELVKVLVDVLFNGLN